MENRIPLFVSMIFANYFVTLDLMNEHAGVIIFLEKVELKKKSISNAMGLKRNPTRFIKFGVSF